MPAYWNNSFLIAIFFCFSVLTFSNPRFFQAQTAQRLKAIFPLTFSKAHVRARHCLQQTQPSSFGRNCVHYGQFS
jgi:hypothetical protein